jgi:hypothetical protein
MGKPVEYTYLFTPTELVVMRKPKRFSYPPQAANSVGVSHLTQLHSGSRQFVGCHNKTTKAETTAVKTIPANTLETLPFVISVGDAETGTLYEIAKVEKNRNSTSVTNHPFRGVESTKILRQ